MELPFTTKIEQLESKMIDVENNLQELINCYTEPNIPNALILELAEIINDKIGIPVIELQKYRRQLKHG